VAQFKKTKSNRNIFGRSSSRSKEGSKNLLLGLNTKTTSDIRNKSENPREDNLIETKTSDTNNGGIGDDETETSTPPTLSILALPAWDEEQKSKPPANIFVIEALDSEDDDVTLKPAKSSSKSPSNLMSSDIS
jgi:hypothetical protein